MNSIRRINIFGGPSASKSTAATYLFSELKSKDFSIELVLEYIKLWTYLKRNPEGFDHLYIFSKGIYKEDIILRNKVDYVISDCPLLLTYFYSQYYKFPGYEFVVGLALKFEQMYPSLNILLKRENKSYDELGRFHNYEEAQEIDNALKETLDKLHINYEEFVYNEKEEILNYIIKNLNNETI